MTMSGAGFIDSELRSIMIYIKTRMLMFYLNVVLWTVKTDSIDAYACLRDDSRLFPVVYE